MLTREETRDIRSVGYGSSSGLLRSQTQARVSAWMSRAAEASVGLAETEARMSSMSIAVPDGDACLILGLGFRDALCRNCCVVERGRRTVVDRESRGGEVAEAKSIPLPPPS